VFRVFNLKGFTMPKAATKVADSADLVQQFLSLCEQPQIKALLASSIATKAEALAKTVTDKPAGMVALPAGVAKKTGKPYASKVGLRVADGKWQHLFRWNSCVSSSLILRALSVSARNVMQSMKRRMNE
jgi:hypothetical protein